MENLILSNFTTPAFLCDSLSVKVPSAVHHCLEVSVVVHTHGDIIVIFEPFVHTDLTISGILVSWHITEVVLKCVQELHQDFVFCFLAGFDVRVLLCIICLPDVIDINLSRAIRVHGSVRSPGNLCSEVIHLPSDSSQEFVVGDFAASVSVEDPECLSHLLWVQTNSEVMHSFLEFSSIETLGIVVVSNFELFANSSNASGTSCCNSFSNVFEQLLFVCIEVKVLFWSWSLSSSVTENVWACLLSSSFRSLLWCIIELPGICDHCGKVCIIVDRGRNVVVVLVELFSRDNIIWRLIILHRVSSLKGL